MEVTTEAMMSETPGPQPEEHASECEAVTMVTAETSDGVVSSESADSQTHVPACQQPDVTPHTGTASHRLTLRKRRKQPLKVPSQRTQRRHRFA